MCAQHALPPNRAGIARRRLQLVELVIEELFRFTEYFRQMLEVRGEA
jgi:hypothetical protein